MASAHVITAHAPIIRLQKTGYYVTYSNGTHFTDETGHGWFCKNLARQYAAEIDGWFELGNRSTVKEVVMGYQS